MTCAQLFRRGWRAWRAERGAGSVAALAVIAAIVLVAASLLPVLGALRVQQRLAGAADAAALAAADTLSGRVPGYPCPNAQSLVEHADAALAECTNDGLIAEVRVTTGYGPLRLSARARAGPPGSR